MLNSSLRWLAAAIFDRRVARLATLALWAGAALVASPAAAQVMDISRDGTVSVRRGNGAATFEVQDTSSSSSSQSGAVATWGPAVPSRAITTMNQALIPLQYADARRIRGIFGQHQSDLARSPDLAGEPLERPGGFARRARWASPS